MKSHSLKCLQCPKEIKKKFKLSTTQISTLDVNEYDVIDDQVQIQSISKVLFYFSWCKCNQIYFTIIKKYIILMNQFIFTITYDILRLIHHIG